MPVYLKWLTIKNRQTIQTTQMVVSKQNAANNYVWWQTTWHFFLSEFSATIGLNYRFDNRFKLLISDFLYGCLLTDSMYLSTNRDCFPRDSKISDCTQIIH